MSVRHDALRFAEVVEQSIELSVREVGRQQMQIGVVGFLDGLDERSAALEALLAESLDARPDAEGEARGRLGIEIPQQDARCRRRRPDTTG